MSAIGSEPDGVDVVRADGGLVHIRSVTRSDLAGLRALHAHASDRSIFLRFFSVSRATGEDYLATLIQPSSRNHHALVACVREEIVGVADYARLDNASAEIALLVADDSQHEGIGTLLLEHLASIARHAGLRRFVAEVLGENTLMIRVLRDIGFRTSMAPDRETMHVIFDLDPVERAIVAIAERERSADAASLQPLLAPGSVVVVGASDRVGSVGNQVLANILEGGFTGAVHVVNPRHASVLGVSSVLSPAELPVAPDLAVVAVPAAHVPGVVRACGERGARAVLLLSAGFGEAGVAGKELQDEVLAIAREYGMRLVGPNCVGVLNTDPAVRLDATFAVLPMLPGGLGLLSQSGAFGVALLVAAARCGLGVSQFVSVGNKADVSGNDMLLYWEQDPHTRVIGMYLESLGDPRTFARIARRISRCKPILAIKSGSTAAGQRAGRSHTAAAASSEVAVDALFRKAGVLRMSTMQEMLDASRVLTEQPLPSGPRVAIIGNSGGPGILAADAAVAAGLTVVELDSPTQALLRSFVPSAASTQNPVDLGSGVTSPQVGNAMDVLLASAQVDAILTVFTEIAVSGAREVQAAVVAAAATSDKPVVATEVGGVACSVPIVATGRSLPVFTFPEPAARALGVAYRYAQIQADQLPPILRLAHTGTAPARELVDTALAAGVEWLGPEDVVRLLEHYGVPVCPQRVVSTVCEAVQAASELGYPVALKIAEGVLHKTDVGGVRLGVSDEIQLRHAYAELTESGPAETRRLLVQPMVRGGTEVIVGAVHDEVGSLIMLGQGGVLADLTADRAFRLAPLSNEDAEAMIASLQLARLLDGYRGAPVVPRAALRDVLVAIAALADDLPEVAELDLNPVICRADGLLVVDARIRLARARPVRDPLLRQLRGRRRDRDAVQPCSPLMPVRDIE